MRPYGLILTSACGNSCIHHLGLQSLLDAPEQFLPGKTVETRHLNNFHPCFGINITTVDFKEPRAGPWRSLRNAILNLYY